MTSNMTTYDATETQYWSKIFAGNYGAICSSALLIFDYVLTLPAEVELIWTDMSSGISLLFMLNRFSTLQYAGAQVLVSATSWPAGFQPSWVHVMNIVSQIIPLVVWGAVTALRAFAITNRSGAIISVILTFSLLSIAPQLTQFNGESTKYYFTADSFICASVGPNSTVMTLLHEGAFFTAYACLIIEDIIVFLATIFQTHHIVKDGKIAGIKTPLATMLLRDGAMYFVIAAGSNMLQIAIYAIFWRSPSFMPSFLPSALCPQTINSIIVTRLILNLRSFSRRTNVMNATSHGLHIPTVTVEVSELQFASRFVTDMGGPLDRALGFGEYLDEEAGDDQAEAESGDLTGDTGPPMQWVLQAANAEDPEIDMVPRV